jgi:hypothetical protein
LNNAHWTLTGGIEIKLRDSSFQSVLGLGRAIRAFYGLNNKGNSTPGSGRLRSSLLAKVRTRLEENKISEPEFLDILRCAQISEAAGASRNHSPDRL